MGALDELLTTWRSNPDAESTVAICSYLRFSGPEALIREVGTSAEAWHINDPAVMLAVGRMYLDGGLLVEAQAALVAAGKADARDARAFRFLGEVLLRRGDAMRAEKVLARALQLGADSEARLWHDRAVVYVALQKRVGAQAVATEVLRTLPKQTSIPPPALAAGSGGFTGEEATTVRRAPTGAPGKRSEPPPLPKSVPPPLPKTVPPPPLPPAPFAAPQPFAAPVAEPFAAPAPAPFPDVPPPPAFGGSPMTPAVPARDPLPMNTGALSPRTPLGGFEPAPGSAPAPPGGYGGSFEPAPVGPEPIDYSPVDIPNPEPTTVLEHLARVGVYEPKGGAPPAWEMAAPQKTRGAWVLILATVLVAGSGAGAYAYAHHIRLEKMALAKSMTDQVDKLLHDGTVAGLRSTDDKLSRIFDLDSRSQRAAKLWLENRVLGGLILPGEPRGIDSAVHRATSIDVPEKDVAFGRIASFLADGDLAGAASQLPKWDKLAGDSAFYQLAAGATLDRAGDLRAVERFQAARDRDPQLIVAKIMLARVVLLEVGVDKAKPIIDAMAKQVGERADVKSLRALAWVVDPARPEKLPGDADVTPADVERLPVPLRAVPYMVAALQAIQAGELDKATKSINSAIGLSDTPAVATRLGFLAIQAGDAKLARKAALRALAYSAVYPGARVLASRVALLSGRVAEAKKAIEGLDPHSSDVIVVRAVLAYETLDGSDLDAAVEAFGDAASSRADLAGLAAAPHVLAGKGQPVADKLEEMARPQIPWGELVAIDAALDTGNLEVAAKIEKNWSDDALEQPVFAIRAARLARYQDKAADAVKASGRALDAGNVTARDLVERVYDQLSGDDAAGAVDLVAKYPSLLGPMTAWLQVLTQAVRHKNEAKAKVAQLDLPPEGTPLLLRILIARALGATGDKRAKSYIGEMLRGLPKNPDLLKAADDLVKK